MFKSANGLTSPTSSSSVEQSQSSSSESSSISTSSSSSQEKKVDTSAYDSIISKYQTAVANNQTDASLNSFVVTYANSQTSSTALKPYDLKNGNYKSAVGTWKSSNGKTITITSDGQLDFWGYTYPIDKVSPNQYVSGIYTLTYVDSSPVGNTPIQLCPKGVSDASDAGDNSKDRILATNGMPSEESYFYRVD